MKTNELRKKFLDFYKKREHAIVPSSSVVPENDSTTLFTGSGMQPLLQYLLGQKHPAGTRLVNSQKSFRAEDIDEVGDNRHTTFFEMLGNWSLGDYFKEEQLPWFFEFLTKELKIPILTDIHNAEQCQIISKHVDILQIPAFLCRQTDLLIAAAKTNKIINVKKGQFLAPWDMVNVTKKISDSGNENILVTERGASFGYNTLVSYVS